ncbi:hypothetical protein M0M57_07585 [Flavobacterium azooxidireducens]|uniref:Uncharacterized protein n=1 Tax=Flavobacterium azooxidireducens TaxID=1871076 RepID=A0ABY4KN76_9FLAO|nr:hypothetical protein [Flavobacterium azooxidireducens]UPQ80692.1 hypothetical protein M0M57_07585 [Flavobacterium azooxidireducens]
MTDNEIKEIEDRCKLTTPGPWKSLVEGREIESGDSFIMTGISESEDIWSDKRGADIYLTGATTVDQDFIAHARQDIPKLITEIKRLKSK